MVADDLYIGNDPLRLALDLNHLLLTKLNISLRPIELISQRVQRGLMPFLLLSEPLSHLAHSLLFLLKLLFNLSLESSELKQLLLTLGQKLLVFGVVLNELGLLALNLSYCFLCLVDLRDVVLHVVADLDVIALEGPELIC